MDLQRIRESLEAARDDAEFRSDGLRDSLEKSEHREMRLADAIDAIDELLMEDE